MARVLVGLSGGIDSAVAAGLLKRAGHEVVGLTLVLPGAAQDPGPARAVAQSLGIEHLVVDARGMMRERVIVPSVRAYCRGLTPNPCALCNREVKFALLTDWARKLGCEQVATGHYARVVEASGRKLLAEIRGYVKSQAYFLARVPGEWLERINFPLGKFTKPHVRELAREWGIEQLVRAESQDVCFVPEGGWQQLVEELGELRPGRVVDMQGRVLGEHEGLHRFTVGQRRGLGLAVGQRVYVVELDGQEALVRVGPKEALMRSGLVGREAMWYLEPGGEELKVRIRYRHKPVPCQSKLQGNEVTVVFAEPQAGVAPGQLAVFYLGDLVVGSAWIEKGL